MNARNQNYYRMLTAVRSVLGKHETDKTWNQIPALVTAVEDLDAVITSIGEHLEITVTPSGASAGKTSAFDTLVFSAHEVSAGLHACATAAGNDALATQTDYSPSDLADGREADVVARCAKILTLANESLESLSDYNITQAKLTALGRRIDGFKQAWTKPRSDVAEKAV